MQCIRCGEERLPDSKNKSVGKEGCAARSWGLCRLFSG